MTVKTLPYTGTITRIATNHDVSDIMKQILSAHKLHRADYDMIAPQFWKGSVKATADYLFDWCKKNIPYAKEPGKRQTSRSPGAIVALSKKVGGDCKHYALWIAGILDGLKRLGYPVNWRFVFASYDQSNIPGHVFVSVKVNGSDYWIDPVLSFVNKRVPYPDHIIYKSMALDHISGVGALRPPADYTGINPYEGGDIIRPDIFPGTTQQEVLPAAKKISPALIVGGVLVLYFVFKRKRKK